VRPKNSGPPREKERQNVLIGMMNERTQELAVEIATNSEEGRRAYRCFRLSLSLSLSRDVIAHEDARRSAGRDTPAIKVSSEKDFSVARESLDSESRGDDQANISDEGFIR